MHLSLYQAATALAARTVRGGKLGASLEGRLHASCRWHRWAEQSRASRLLIWVHAASVGEALAADPIAQRLECGGAQVVRTFSSPSAAGWAGLAGDHADYVPLDVRSHVTRTLDALRPDALVFSRGDLWPVLVGEAARRRIPIAVVGGQVRAASRRLRWPARNVLGAAHGALTLVDVVSHDDATRWEALGAPREAIRVTGDPRHDGVLDRPLNTAAIRPILEWCEARTTAIAGSLELADEPLLLKAMGMADGEAPSRWILVPHEPENPAVGRLLSGLAARGIPAEAWTSGAVSARTRAVVVASRGHLADLYLAGDVGYVGGGFGGRGVHSLAEPASVGVPVVFGARPTEGDSALLAHAGGGVALAAPDPGALLDVLLRWLRDGGVRGRAAGLAARGALQGGAAAASAAAIGRLAGSTGGASGRPRSHHQK